MNHTHFVGWTSKTLRLFPAGYGGVNYLSLELELFSPCFIF